MKKAATLAAAALLAAAFCGGEVCFAADKGNLDGRAAVLGIGRAAVSTAELGQQQARGIAVENAISNGTVTANSVGAGSSTGTITNNNSINNNVGITTVFQNTGNNSLFQASTSIFISVPSNAGTREAGVKQMDFRTAVRLGRWPVTLALGVLANVLAGAMAPAIAGSLY